MTIWKNEKEKRTPFSARGTGRLRDLEDRVETLEAQSSAQQQIMAVEQPPETCQDNIVYIVYETSND